MWRKKHSSKGNNSNKQHCMSCDNCLPCIENKAKVTYEYQVRPTDPLVHSQKISNTVSTYPRYIQLSMIETVDRKEALVGESLFYSIEIKNTGNVEVFDICFCTVLAKEACFVSGSVVINGIKKINVNPTKGIRLGRLEGCECVSIMFRVSILAIPCDDVIYNQTQLCYDYFLDQRDTCMTATIFSNQVKTLIKNMRCIVEKRVNKAYAQQDDYLAYEVIIQNTGNVEMEDIVFKDDLCHAVQFVPHTIYINGICYKEYDPVKGFSLNNMKSKAVCRILFFVQVIGVPIGRCIKNISEITTSYQLVENEPNITKTVYSNEAITFIQSVAIEISKCVDKDYAQIGDELTYTLTIRNVGNIRANQVCLVDLIPIGTYYKAHSIRINGIKEYYDPGKVLLLRGLKPQYPAIIQFSVIVNQLVKDTSIINRAEVYYQYCWNPRAAFIEGRTVSDGLITVIQRKGLKYNNTVQGITNIEDSYGVEPIANLAVDIKVNLKYATLDDILIYTIRISNTGNTKVTKVNLRDILPKEMLFIRDSVRIDGKIKLGYDPYSSFSLGTIEINRGVEIVFKYRIKDMPLKRRINNEAIVTFAYKSKKTGKEMYKEVVSNRASTYIEYEQLDVTKYVDVDYATGGDKITYTFVIDNKGSVEVRDVVLIDRIQKDVDFKKGSVTIDKKSSGYNPEIGIPIGSIASMQTVEVVFQVIVKQQIRIGILLNSGIVQFKYCIHPYEKPYIGKRISNSVYTFLIEPKIKVHKLINQRYSHILNNLSYTVWLVNEGNTEFENVFFKDELPNGISFIQESIEIGEQPHELLNPVTGFYLPTMPIGDVIKIQFEALVEILSSSESKIHDEAIVAGQYRVGCEDSYRELIESNDLPDVEIRRGDIRIIQYVSSSYAQVGDVFTYTVVLTHEGNMPIKDLSFFNNLMDEVEFISNSLSINNRMYKDMDMKNGIWLGRLLVGEQMTIRFNVRVKCLPNCEYIENKSLIKFKYQVSMKGTNVYKSKFSNTTITYITLAILEVKQSCDKRLAIVGESVTYRVQIINTGNVRANSVYFRELIKEGIEIKSDTIQVIEKGVVAPYLVDIRKGFKLNNIDVGDIVTVVFEAIIMANQWKNRVVSQSEVEFEYENYIGDQVFTKKIYSDKCITYIITGDIKIVKQVDKEIVGVGECLTYSVNVINTGNVDVRRVHFVDDIPDYTMFIRGSVYINGVCYSEYYPQVGFGLGTIMPGQIVKIKYQVQIISELI